MYDPRVARFFAVDPIAREYPELTPYQHSSLNPIWLREVEGLEGQFSDPSVAGGVSLGLGTGKGLFRSLAVIVGTRMNFPQSSASLLGRNSLSPRLQAGFRLEFDRLGLTGYVTGSMGYSEEAGTVVSSATVSVGTLGQSAHFSLRGSAAINKTVAGLKTGLLKSDKAKSQVSTVQGLGGWPSAKTIAKTDGSGDLKLTVSRQYTLLPVQVSKPDRIVMTGDALKDFVTSWGMARTPDASPSVPPAVGPLQEDGKY